MLLYLLIKLKIVLRLVLHRSSPPFIMRSNKLLIILPQVQIRTLVLTKNTRASAIFHALQGVFFISFEGSFSRRLYSLEESTCYI